MQLRAAFLGSHDDSEDDDDDDDDDGNNSKDSNSIVEMFGLKGRDMNDLLIESGIDGREPTTLSYSYFIRHPLGGRQDNKVGLKPSKKGKIEKNLKVIVNNRICQCLGKMKISKEQHAENEAILEEYGIDFRVNDHIDVLELFVMYVVTGRKQIVGETLAKQYAFSHKACHHVLESIRGKMFYKSEIDAKLLLVDNVGYGNRAGQKRKTINSQSCDNC